MTAGESSCRPARLERFESTLDAVCDGLARRVGTIEAALDAYQRSCDGDYRAETADTAPVVRAFATGLRDLGRWTGDVGRAFTDAAVVEAYMGTGGSGDFESPVTATDETLVGHLDDEWDDPFRGVPEGVAARLALDLGDEYDQDEPPAWIDELATGGTVADMLTPLLDGTVRAMAGLPPGVAVTVRAEAGTLLVLSDGAMVARLAQVEVQARFRLPASGASRLATASRWLGRAGTAATAVSSAAGQWDADQGLPARDRVLRAGTRASADAVGGAAGAAALAWAGVEAGAACGPWAPACSTVGGVVGGIAGAVAGQEIVGWGTDHLPWMDDPEPLAGEHDLDAVEDVVAGDDDIDAALAARSDLLASDLAMLGTAEEPVLQDRARGLLPPRAELESIVAGLEPPPAFESTAPAPAPPDAAPDPWPRARPWE